MTWVTQINSLGNDDPRPVVVDLADVVKLSADVLNLGLTPKSRDSISKFSAQSTVAFDR